MRRRDFLAGSAATLAARTTVAEAPTWTLTAGRDRYVIRLQGAALICDCQGSIDEDEALGTPGEAAMVVAGRRPVSWRVAASHQPNPHTLRIALAALDYPLAADIVHAIDPDTGILSRTSVLRHLGVGPVVDIAETLSFWHRIAESVDRMLYLAGDWAHETQLRRGQGDVPLELESRAGKTGFAFQPYVALQAGETIWLCQIFWSGNWTLRVEPTDRGVVLSGGLNNWRFQHRLAPGGSLVLPTILFGRFDGGLNVATRSLHDWRRMRRPNPDRVIPVQFNSWYPYFGDRPRTPCSRLCPWRSVWAVRPSWSTPAGIVPMKANSAETWEARTGDWRISRRRFPNGLREISEACREQDMRFGLWFEPEVIGPLSTLRREHPDWLHHIDGKPPAEDARGVLNLGIPAARRHVFERVTRILSTVGVDWMKWDFNTDLGAGGWAPGLAAALTDQDPLVAHYDGLYRLQDAVRRWFPDLILEMCASGGGRLDGAILSHAHVNWISDQPGALRKLAIHFGTQLAHPAVACNDWLVEWPPGNIAGYDEEDAGTLDERGDLPFGCVSRCWAASASARGRTAGPRPTSRPRRRMSRFTVTTVRAVVHHGDQYLLTRPPDADGSGEWAAIWYVAKDASRGVLFAFRLGSEQAARVFPLPGLTGGRRYRARLFDGAVQ